MADVTINNLVGQVPTTSDVFPFSTTGVTPSTYKASLAQMKTALGLATVASTGSYTDLSNKPTIPIVPTIIYCVYNTTDGFISAASKNVSSVSWDGYAYTVNYSVTLPTNNHAVVITGGFDGDGEAASIQSMTSSSVRFIAKQIGIGGPHRFTRFNLIAMG
jgi:hypothetical protein